MKKASQVVKKKLKRKEREAQFRMDAVSKFPWTKSIERHPQHHPRQRLQGEYGGFHRLGAGRLLS